MSIGGRRACRLGFLAIVDHDWHLDVTFKEDANKTLDKQAAQNQKHHKEMEPEHTENNGDTETGLVYEEEAV